ncbi:uncharacterized protein LOC128745881 [Sabethes cyaneus]|uniref:uncharacterized protein LOC128745881 n=1 Tax=Sabethes cyaneus TaxID=53552 RepID=UPI00237D3D04|nr:uncharacterized protein LOC128745881 [Sabethes cyaneus]
MASTCRTCSSAVNGIDRVICRGNCRSMFHRTCIPGLQRSTLDAISTYGDNLFWLCDECASSFNKWLQQPDPVATVAPVDDSSKLCDAVDKLNTAVADLSYRIEKHFPCGSSVPALKIFNSRRQPGELPTPKRSRVDSAKDYASAVAVCGTRSIQRTIKTVADERQQFWLYLSRLDPSHTVDDIVAMTQECLDITDTPKTIMLVKKNVDLSSLNFVSFRVEVPKELKDTALMASTWPTGVLVREFDFDQERSTRFRQ